MTVNVPVPPTTAEPLGRHVGPDRRGTRKLRQPGPERGSSPRAGERVRELTRGQIEDRMGELGDLYAQTSGGGPWAWNQARSAFLRRLVADVRRPGFELVIAETTELTGCAYGFPVRGDGPWWEGLDGYLPGSLLRAAASGRLFVMLVSPSDSRTAEALQSWGWRYVEGDAPRTSPFPHGPLRVLILGA
ncbi:hypothetical protein [Streptomyces sp. UG1]|uniref:hypothetical protein n=1 Tax=Streptomyces sp. UG1 TaxID=3417652 RepID=UPI003CE700D9